MNIREAIVNFGSKGTIGKKEERRHRSLICRERERERNKQVL
jgi:hypothetical protein